MIAPHTTASSASLRLACLHLLQINALEQKATQVRGLDAARCTLDPAESFTEPTRLPGRPERPQLVHPSQLKTRAVGTPEGRAGLIHALTHIEANAINLALDVVWRFSGMPDDFYKDWWRVAQEEALHFELLNAHLNEMGFAYGDFPAHDGLWDMAERTKSDVLARLALVPRTLEARGLDATPAVRNRLVSVGDQAAAQILDIILRDEINHVAIGNRWYRFLCVARQLDPVSTYAVLAQRYQAPQLKGPFNLAARRAAGFTEDELAALNTSTRSATA
ncbi:ferritin-like domain-containing protein [Rhodoferax sp.]|uniref:ferritin-like domain-containing protein n=1 Tax=Rhodoferax sp. TaxID=50421 RepID=UPI0025CD699E|nr:ferritin-like domain-containing protein [Rhodoferax sp.]